MGTNALLGHLGSGKTSVLNGICFSLFGTFPELQTKKLKIDDLIMKKPTEKDKAEVEVYFQIDGTIYSVKRIVEKGKGTTYSEFRENCKLIESPNSQRVTEAIEKVLKVDYELFNKAIYSEQNALDYFLTIPKGQRMKKIDELLMIDKFEKARAGAVALTNKIAERKLGKQSIVEQTDLDELQRLISELRLGLDNDLKEKISLQKTLESITYDKSKLEKEYSELKKTKENLEVLKREEKGLDSAIKETTVFIQSLEVALKGTDRVSIEKNLNSLKNFSRELEDLLREKQKKYQKLQEQASKAKAEVEFLRKEKIEKLEKELKEKTRIKNEFEKYKKDIGENIEKQLEEGKLKLEKIIGETEALKMKIRDSREIIEQLSLVKAKCPICERRLEDERKSTLIKQKKTQIENFMGILEKSNKEKIVIEKKIKELESDRNKLERMLNDIKNFDDIKKELENTKNIYVVLSESSVKMENELAELRNELEEIQNKLKDVTEKKQQNEILVMKFMDYLSKKQRFEELTRQRERIFRQLTELEKQLEGKGLNEMENWLRNLIAKEKETTMRILGIEQIVKEKDVRLKEFERTLFTVTKEREEIKKLDKLIVELKIFTKALESTQVELRKEFIEAVNYTMGKLWNTLYPYKDFIGIKLIIDEGDYVLQLQETSGKFVNVEGVASGGERSIACLALRIAFALVLAPHIRMLVLDEPTMNLDVTAVRELATTLIERIGEFIDQTFLITHQAELEDAVTGHAYRFERDKTKDDVTKVISIT